MAAYSIAFDHLLKTGTVSEFYRVIEAWLHAEGAKMKRAQPPNLPEAVLAELP